MMPVVKIDMWSGRDEKQKEAIIKKVTDAIVEMSETFYQKVSEHAQKHLVFDTCGCPKEAVTVVIDDIPKENWGSGGEQHSKKFKNIK